MSKVNFSDDFKRDAVSKILTADVEGLTIIQNDNKRWLIASSQGDNIYAIFTLPRVEFAGRFEIGASEQYGAASETVCIDAMAGSFGSEYPEGIFVAQDGDNGYLAQNSKILGWREIRQAFRLE